MQFMITGLDGTDEHALNRRLAAREAHIARSDELIQTGNILYGVALLDENDSMIGSVMIVEFSDRNGLDEWLHTEPYVTANVWQTIDIKPCRVGPSFVDLHSKPAP